MGGNGKREAGKVNLEWCPEKGGWAIQVVWFVVILENYKRQARSTNTSFLKPTPPPPPQEKIKNMKTLETTPFHFRPQAWSEQSLIKKNMEQ